MGFKVISALPTASESLSVLVVEHNALLAVVVFTVIEISTTASAVFFYTHCIFCFIIHLYNIYISFLSEWLLFAISVINLNF